MREYQRLGNRPQGVPQVGKDMRDEWKKRRDSNDFITLVVPPQLADETPRKLQPQFAYNNHIIGAANDPRGEVGLTLILILICFLWLVIQLLRILTRYARIGDAFRNGEKTVAPDKAEERQQSLFSGRILWRWRVVDFFFPIFIINQPGEAMAERRK